MFSLTSFSRHCLVDVLLLLPLVSTVHAGSKDITIDDDSPLITYAGRWEGASMHKSTLNYGGQHPSADDPGATATLVFTGTAIQYIAPLWPYAVNSGIKLDSFAKVDVNLTDPNASTTDGGSESSMYGVRWSQTGLSNTSHTLVVSMATQNPTYVVVDAFTYTVTFKGDGNTTPTPSATSKPTTNAKSSVLPIAVGAAVGGAALVAAIILAVICLKRRKRHQKNMNMHQNGFDAPPITPFSPNAMMSQNHRPNSQPDAPQQYPGHPGLAGTTTSFDGSHNRVPSQSQYGNGSFHTDPHVSQYTDSSRQNILGGGEGDRYSVAASSVVGPGVAGFGAYHNQHNNAPPMPSFNPRTSGYNPYNPSQTGEYNPYDANRDNSTQYGESSSSTARLTAPMGLSLASGSSSGAAGSSSGGRAMVADEKAFIRSQKELHSKEDRAAAGEDVVAPPAYTD